MKLSWATLNQPNFLNALKKIKEYDTNSEGESRPKLPATTRLRLATISQVVYFEMLKAQGSAKALLKKYAAKDDRGEVIGYPDTDKITFGPGKEKEHDDAFIKILKTQFKIDSLPVPVSSLECVGLSTNELLALKPILKDI